MAGSTGTGFFTGMFNIDAIAQCDVEDGFTAPRIDRGAEHLKLDQVAERERPERRANTGEQRWEVEFEESCYSGSITTAVP
mgnify:CR=1 FL=1